MNPSLLPNIRLFKPQPSLSPLTNSPNHQLIPRLLHPQVANAASQTPSPPLHLFHFTVRNLSMQFFCAQQPVPWWIVVHIANRMSGFVRQGWSAGEWELKLVNQAAQMAIIVGMKIVAGGLPPVDPGTPDGADSTGVAIGDY